MGTAGRQRILDNVATGRYEEAIGVGVSVARSEINKRHMLRLRAFRQDAEVKDALNRAKQELIKERVFAKAKRLYRIGLTDEALRLLDEAEELGPAERAFAGRLWARKGRYDKAVALFERAVAEREEAIDAIHLGDAYEKLGRIEDARAWFEEAVRRGGGATSSQLLARSLFMTGQYAEARAHLEHVRRIDPSGLDWDLYTRCRQRARRRGLSRAVLPWMGRIAEAHRSPLFVVLAAVLAGAVVVYPAPALALITASYLLAPPVCYFVQKAINSGDEKAS